MVHCAFDPADPEAGLKLLEELTSNAEQVQQQVLVEILSRNARTEYLKQFLNGQSDQELFKKNVPIVGYEDIHTYIDRIADGEPSEIIVTQPITHLSRSSATSGGRQKLLPMTDEDLGRRTFVLNLIIALMNKHLKGLEKGKVMYLVFMKPEYRTSGGTAVIPSSTSYYKSSHFKNKSKNPFNIQTSPDDILLCPDSKQSKYCQLLCGLVQRDEVLRVGTLFATAFLHVIRFLEDHWRELCSNIRTGEISDWITDPSCRLAVSSVISKGMPELADLIEQDCCGKSWKGIIRRLWPKAKCVEVVYTGSLAQYIPTLQFYTGSLPLVSMRYVSSEGYFGINVDPLCHPSEVSYTLLPNAAYFEFLPVDHILKGVTQENHSNGILDSNSMVVDLANVKIGQCYELLVTTYIGLYRYRIGDILKVTGFYNNAPKFQFVQRAGAVLSVDQERTTEEDLLRAITRAVRIIEPLGFLLKDCTSYADASSNPGHYVLFWETQKKENAGQPELDRAVMEECCFMVEQSLDSVYRMIRNVPKDIGPLEIRVVKLGTFEELMDYLISQGTSLTQYKTPTSVKSDKAIEILNSGVVASFSSKKLPLWRPLDSSLDHISEIQT